MRAHGAHEMYTEAIVGGARCVEETGPEEAQSWKPFTLRFSLHANVLAVATTRIEGAWCAYIGPAYCNSHRDDEPQVLRQGTKLLSEHAKAMFPEFEGVPYAH